MAKWGVQLIWMFLAFSSAVQALFWTDRQNPILGYGFWFFAGIFFVAGVWELFRRKRASHELTRSSNTPEPEPTDGTEEFLPPIPMQPQDFRALANKNTGVLADSLPENPVRILLRTAKSAAKTDLQEFDELLASLAPIEGRRLVFSDFGTSKTTDANLIEALLRGDGLGGVICSEISYKTDLIPHVGMITPSTYPLLRKFIDSKKSIYSEILVFVRPEGHRPWSQLLTAPGAEDNLTGASSSKRADQIYLN